jgi:hypothetical protein
MSTLHKANVDFNIMKYIFTVIWPLRTPGLEIRGAIKILEQLQKLSVFGNDICYRKWQSQKLHVEAPQRNK